MPFTEFLPVPASRRVAVELPGWSGAARAAVAVKPALGTRAGAAFQVFWAFGAGTGAIDPDVLLRGGIRQRYSGGGCLLNFSDTGLQSWPAYPGEVTANRRLFLVVDFSVDAGAAGVWTAPNGVLDAKWTNLWTW